MILTKVRSQIIKTFNNTNKPLSALDLIRKIVANKTTIYRELDFLINLGIINSVDFGDGLKRYELKSLDHHHHMVCLTCKRIIDVNINEEFNIPKDFKVIRHSLEFFGFCSGCQ